MFGKYYFGALYGDLDYYFLYGAEVPSVIDQYTTLTGRPTFRRAMSSASIRAATAITTKTSCCRLPRRIGPNEIPIDGLHIDVDFQDNYRTFTSSNKKFPNAQQMFATLHQQGFKCSTNITPLVTSNPLDENNNPHALSGARQRHRPEHARARLRRIPL